MRVPDSVKGETESLWACAVRIPVAKPPDVVASMFATVPSSYASLPEKLAHLQIAIPYH